MFINTRNEAQIAARIARKFGFEILSADKFYKKYTTNVFSPWSSQNNAHRALTEIAAALRAARSR